ncbi:UDP-glucuronic acid decarboxylase 1-like [Oncorhynchus kisutch]|uniref:UDP-glucuronic acid decarboxylase 1-like n=1 Tax=Oncorhynchus kisutch TaxID=8019 RepID=UPI0012DEB37C|nr:UDP-glucuronic acid decarboxylase 1-like [Oncorhynchus kisutch]
MVACKVIDCGVEHQIAMMWSQPGFSITAVTLETAGWTSLPEELFSQKYPPVKFLSEKDWKRILITGGAGFVGSHLTDKLMMDGHEGTVVDNFFTSRKRNMEHWIGHENFELINHDVALHRGCDDWFDYSGLTLSPGSTLALIDLVWLAKRVGARLLLASTSEVYGVEVRVARIFNTFGSRMNMNNGRVVRNFILQALQGEALTVFGSGSQTRAFQHVSHAWVHVDLVNGLVSLMNSNISSPVNLGNPEEHTILEFAELIRSLVVSRSQIQFLPEGQDDPQRRRPDIPKAKIMLGWEPVVPLEEGLNKTIQYFSRELEHQANNQYIPKPKAARQKKGQPRHHN